MEWIKDIIFFIYTESWLKHVCISYSCLNYGEYIANMGGFWATTFSIAFLKKNRTKIIRKSREIAFLLIFLSTSVILLSYVFGYFLAAVSVYLFL